MHKVEPENSQRKYEHPKKNGGKLYQKRAVGNNKAAFILKGHFGIRSVEKAFFIAIIIQGENTEKREKHNKRENKANLTV